MVTGFRLDSRNVQGSKIWGNNRLRNKISEESGLVTKGGVIFVCASQLKMKKVWGMLVC